MRYLRKVCSLTQWLLRKVCSLTLWGALGKCPFLIYVVPYDSVQSYSMGCIRKV